MGYLKDHLEKLPSLIAIEEMGSIRKAAPSLRITQPALTRQVLILEDLLGHKLFSRTTQGVILTKEGKLVSDFARKLLIDVEKLETSLQPETGVETLRIGTFESLSIRLWPGLVAKVRERCAQTRLGVSTGDTQELFDKVVRGDIDCAMTLLMAKVPRFLESRLLFQDAYGLFASAKFPTTKIFRPSELKKFPIVSVQGVQCTLGDSLMDELQSKGISLEDFLSVDTFEAGANYARENVGIAVLPYVIAKPSLAKGKLVPVLTTAFPDNRFGVHNMGLLFRKDSPKMELLQKLENLLLEFFQTI